VQEARLSMGTPVQPEALLPCLEELAAAVAGWQRRVKLVWPYSGGRVELSGEAVGGWDRKVALAFDVQRRQWVLWLWVSRAVGLPRRMLSALCLPAAMELCVASRLRSSALAV
jgi:hypothetical protein